jgi:RNA polymerase sigma-70 factor (ECF subfamily)
MTTATAILFAATQSASADPTIRAAIDAHYDALWRFLRRMGVSDGHVEDAAQNVFIVFSRRASSIEPPAVRAFLFGTAIRVASDFRRRRGRVEMVDLGQVEETAHPAPNAEQEVAARELRQLLDRVLDELPTELRAVFVLAELDELTKSETAGLLGIPEGTVASRLRRARELFAAKATALRPLFDKEGER